MKISYNWLSSYLPQKFDATELSNILTGIGLEVEGTALKEAIRGGMKGLVTGLVETCEQHENADKLKVTTVRISDETVLSIVCGAPNVAVSQKVIVATIGAELPAPDGKTFKIKKSKLRGALSEGMICAEDEIGVGKSHDGIMVLPEDTPIGLSASDYFKLPQPDIIFEIGLTPNRSDANSHLGIAKDICAYLSYQQTKKISPVYPATKTINKAENQLPITINIENKKDCPRYAGLAMNDVEIAPSPEWLQEKLKSVGITPINNIVDITNFVLQEYGQPLHAFDYNKIKNGNITVKNLAQNTPFQTLDGETYKLSKEDLMICDGNDRPMCMAGIYGGFNSGISGETKTIFIESAYFNHRSIRRSSVRHNLRTEAATHFEKGVAMKDIIPALKRAASLISEIAGGKIASDIIDIYPNPLPDKNITLSFDYLERLCGKVFEKQAVKQLLESLGFPATKYDNNQITVAVPQENQDIHQAADLVEEVLRIDGLDNVPIPEKLNYTLNKSNHKQDYRTLKERIAEFLAYSGLHEIITNSITNSAFYSEKEHLVRLMNSLSSELDILRPEMINSGLEVIAYNQNRKMGAIHIFEFGKTYADKGNYQFEQTEWLSIWSTGNIRSQHWAQPAETSDIFSLKGIITALFALSGLEKVQEAVKDNRFIWKRGKQIIGHLQEIAPSDKKRFNIKQPVYYAAIRLEHLYEAVKKHKIQHEDIPKYPAVKRDLALILPKSAAYEQVAAIAQKQKWEALQDFDLFDIFEHEKIGKDNKSMALSFTFQLKDRTLKDHEVDEMMQKLMEAYKKELKAEIRS